MSERPHPGRPRSEREEGQAAVELALALPLVALLLLAVVQITLVARDQLLVVHAAREGAREAAVEPRPTAPAAAKAAAVRGTGLKEARLAVETSYHGTGGLVTVRVQYRSPTEVPLVGELLPDVQIGAKAAMRVEW